ncbi:hypothetical protein KSP39_PZI019163 [Platanthera zijinensis]|uniref:Uncharacterized protein n=1 Tax=Platanthera zijinensis TaxID=2320716 RepID=A0AAP0B1J6_9ASPA
MLREEVSKEEAQNRILAINEPYKLEILESIKDDSITIYHIANHRQSLSQSVFEGVEAMKQLNDSHVLGIPTISEPSSTPEHVSLYIHCTLFGLPKPKQMC